MAWDKLADDLHAYDRGDLAGAERIRTRFETTHAVLVSDMSGFSRITQKRGIIAFLALIQRMHRLCTPCVTDVGGRVVKAEADNLFAVFPDPDRALTAAIAMHAACRDDNRTRDIDDQVRVALGIGYGPVIDVGEDIFGDELNLASKLGEDLADPGEILLTPAAAAPVQARIKPYGPSDHILQLSGLHLGYIRIAVPS